MPTALSSGRRRGVRWARLLLLAGTLLPGLLAPAAAQAQAARETSEYRLKAAFVYNFMLYTEWPTPPASTVTLCVHGTDPFGREIDGLQGKPLGEASVAVQRRGATDSLRGCDAVFFGAPTPEALPRLLEGLRGHPVLTIAELPGAMQRGVMLNMLTADARVVFEANLVAARAAGLKLSSKLLRLAREVHQ